MDRDSPRSHLERFMTEDTSRVVLDPKILVGKPILRGTRISVEFVLELLAEGWTEPEILDEYPTIKPGDVAVCLRYAVNILSSERAFPSAA